MRYCKTCDAETEWLSTPRSKRAHCTACTRRKRSEAGKRAAVTRARRKEKRGRLGLGLVSYSKLLKRTDDLWSVVCRAEATQCAMCHALLPPDALQWAHHRPRGKPKFLRYHDLNFSALCAPCHRLHSPAGPEWYRWLEKIRLGRVRYEILNNLAQTRGRLGIDDLKNWARLAGTRADQLPSGERRNWAHERMWHILKKGIE